MRVCAGVRPLCTMHAGVGPVMAQEMVTRLGTSVLDVLDSPSAQSILQKCDGIAAVMAAKIKSNWDASRGALSPPAVHVCKLPGEHLPAAVDGSMLCAWRRMGIGPAVCPAGSELMSSRSGAVRCTRLA